uniref:Uncharacterized protein n=1 Tax=Oryza rufipogon TaxID=4529 RepID=A0A0E0PW03_ORYRU
MPIPPPVALHHHQCISALTAGGEDPLEYKEYNVLLRPQPDDDGVQRSWHLLFLPGNTTAGRKPRLVQSYKHVVDSFAAPLTEVDRDGSSVQEARLLVLLPGRHRSLASKPSKNSFACIAGLSRKEDGNLAGSGHGAAHGGGSTPTELLRMRRDSGDGDSAACAAEVDEAGEARGRRRSGGDACFGSNGGDVEEDQEGVGRRPLCVELAEEERDEGEESVELVGRLLSSGFIGTRRASLPLLKIDRREGEGARTPRKRELDEGSDGSGAWGEWEGGACVDAVVVIGGRRGGGWAEEGKGKDGESLSSSSPTRWG